MNCREAQSQIFAERDGALDTSLRAALDGHLASCEGCRRSRENLTAALTAWRIEVTQITVPDAEREWHAVRRRIRGGAESGAETSVPRRNLFTWISIPVGAAAAVAFALFLNSPSPTSVQPESHTGSQIARAGSVDTTDDTAPSMILVDDKSGWTFVWATDAQPKRG